MAETEGKAHPEVVHFAPDAKAAWVAWYDSHVDEINGGSFGPSDTAAEGKLSDFAGRHGAVLHLLHLAADPARGDADPIPPLTYLRRRGGHPVVVVLPDAHRRVRAAIGGKTGDAPEGARLILRWLHNHPVADFKEKPHGRRPAVQAGPGPAGGRSGVAPGVRVIRPAPGRPARGDTRQEAGPDLGCPPELILESEYSDNSGKSDDGDEIEPPEPNSRIARILGLQKRPKGTTPRRSYGWHDPPR